MSEINFRWLERIDVLVIEDFCKDITSLIKKLSFANTFGIVFEKDNNIVGYLMYKSLKTKTKIINMVVHNDFRRMKIGSQMINYLADQQKEKDIEAIVHEENLIMQLFLRNHRFLATEIKKNKDANYYKFIRKYSV